ncbi:MAG TPA: methyltransferase domain-containing protein [Opitutaceae bacterium]|nr:methyltransferase domain-containing protein [Opitutaceae bacterium]
MAEDPTDAAFWDKRYEAHRMPWDFHGVPGDLKRFLAAQSSTRGRVLIPGCGSGYEVTAFAKAGWDVIAIDFSAAAVVRARDVVGPALADRIVLGDFFAHPFAPASFDAIYERTFLCALPPARWPEIATRLATLLKPGGLLFGFYLFAGKEDGPPFGLKPDETTALFDGPFTLVADEAVADSLPLFQGAERWQVRQRVG